MKKVIMAALVACMSLMLVACGSKANVVTGYKTGDVELGQYKGLSFTAKSTEVSEDEINSQVTTNLLAPNQVKVPVTDRTSVQTGDFINLDYMGIKDGVAFDGGTASGAELLIGSGQFIPGFEDAIIGHNLGESFDIDVTFPENYGSSELAGQPVVFNITINEIYSKANPELTDELVAEKTDYETVEAYKASVAASLKAEKEDQAVRDKETELFTQAIENSTFKADLTKQISESKANLLANYNAMYQSYYQVTAEQFYNYVYGMDSQQFNEYFESMAKMSVEYSYLLSAVAEAENVTVTDADIEELKAAMMQSYGLATEEALNAQLKKTYNASPKEVLLAQAKLNKASDIIFDSAVEK